MAFGKKSPVGVSMFEFYCSAVFLGEKNSLLRSLVGEPASEGQLDLFGP